MESVRDKVECKVFKAYSVTLNIYSLRINCKYVTNFEQKKVDVFGPAYY